jgi:hemerythrin-like domain-containing protein
MVESIDAVFAFHNAMRNDMERIDSAACRLAQGEKVPAGMIGRYRLFNEILVWHAHGEEIGVFPRVEKVAPLVVEPYEQDHRGLDRAYEELDGARLADDALRTARATAAFRFHLRMHLDKEETHLYRIFRERISPGEQTQAVGTMAAQIPPERVPDVVGWLFPLIGNDDRENMIRIYQMSLPPPAFAGVIGLVRKAVGDDWMELVQRIPELDSSKG